MYFKLGGMIIVIYSHSHNIVCVLKDKSKFQVIILDVLSSGMAHDKCSLTLMSIAASKQWQYRNMIPLKVKWVEIRMIFW